MEAKNPAAGDIVDRVQTEVKRWLRGFSELDLLAFARGEWVPAADLHAVPGGAELLLDLPGLEAGDVQVVLRGDHVAVSGEKPASQPPGRPLLAERKSGAFRRSVALPFRPDPASVEARLRAGVLRIRLRELGPSQPTDVRVEVRGEDEEQA